MIPIVPCRLRIAVLLCALFCSAVAPRANAQFDRPWQVYLVPFSHTDVGYTAPVDQVLQNHLRYLDTVVAWVGRSKVNLPGEQFRWTIEIPWVLDAYIQQRSPAQVESLMACVRRGDIDIGGMFFGLQTDLCGNEELVRSLIYAQELRNTYNVPVRTALINDTPGFTWSLAQLLPDADIPYLSVAMNSFLCDFFKTTNLPNLFYVQAQSGKKMLIWRSIDPTWAYLEGTVSCNVYAGGPAMMQTPLTKFLQTLASSGYPYNEVMINCATGDNGAPNSSIMYNVHDWNITYPATSLRISTASAFFDTMLSRHGAAIPVYTGDAPNWWTWLFAPSATGANALSRKAHTLLPVAESFASIAAQVNPAFALDPMTLRNAYINNLAFEDHNLGANYNGGNEPFWVLKMGWVNAAVDTGTQVLTRAIDAITNRIPTGPDPVIAVFNPLAWTRSIPATLTASQVTWLGNFDLYDETAQTIVPTQLLHDGSLCFIATNVPPVGYAIFRVQSRSVAFPPTAGLNGYHLENSYYSVEVDPVTGGLLSLNDKAAGREIVATAGRFNQYSYNGAYSPSGMAVVASDSGTVMQSITLQGTAQGVSSLATTVTVYTGLKQVEMRNLYDKLSPTTTETVDFNFSFAMPSPQLRYEVPFGNVRLFDDELSGFRVKHYAFGGWLDVISGGDGFAAALAAENASVTAHPSGTFDGNLRIMTSYNNTGSAYRAGTGLLPMNFSLTTTAGFAVDSINRHAYAFLTPTPVRIIPASQMGTQAGASWSFLRITPEVILLTTVKPPLSGQGWILRLFNPLNQTTSAALKFAGTVLSANETSLLETNKSTLGFSRDSVFVTFGPYEVKTLRVNLLLSTDVEQASGVPVEFGLDQNYPNPFNPKTVVSYQLSVVSRVRLAIYDMLGREVALLVNEPKQPGEYTATWDATGMASGVYFCRLQAGTQTSTIKMMLLR